MKQQLDLIKAAARLLWNKGIAILVLAFLAHSYLGLSSGPEGATPFAEVLYAGILVSSIIVIAPVVRLLVFPEAAEFAESPDLRKALEKPHRTPIIWHYWFATAISYLVTLLCISSLLRF